MSRHLSPMQFRAAEQTQSCSTCAAPLRKIIGHGWEHENEATDYDHPAQQDSVYRIQPGNRL